MKIRTVKLTEEIFMISQLMTRLIAADLSKQKTLDADSRAIQQIISTGKANIGSLIYYILEQSKETILQFSKGTTKVLVISINGWIQ